MTSGPAIPYKVFLAEDSEFLRARIHALMVAAGHEVVGQAATPEACISGILSLKPDAVVLDVELEGGTGLEVLTAVRPADPRVQFVVFSLNASSPHYEHYLGAGAADFLDKRTDGNRLAQAIAEACSRAAR
jgi:DNA-binding NarL/FixJ family response regulator